MDPGQLYRPGCRYGDYRIPRGRYGWLMSFKDDYNPNNEEALDGFAIATNSRNVEFKVGDIVKAALLGGTSHLPPYLNDPPTLHVGQIGTIVRVDPDYDRLYYIEFADGKTVGFYANEIHKP